MERMHYSIRIEAPREKVWDAMLGDDGYRTWTAAFGPGSHFVGDWSEGSTMLFTAPGEGGEMGMVSRIRAHRRYEFISIEHVGIVKEGREVYAGDEVQAWAGAIEEYRFREIDGSTEVLIDVDVDENMKELFATLWPTALQRLKSLAEKRDTPAVKKRTKKKIPAVPRRRKTGR